MFGQTSISHPNIKVITVKARSKKLELPTFIKLIIKSVSTSICHSYDYIMGGDAFGNIIAAKLAQVYRNKHIFFALEFPQIVTEKVSNLGWISKLENASLQSADYVVTHDDFHKRFLEEHFDIDSSKILKLANASYTPIFATKSDWLREKFNLMDNEVLILHSGGLAQWFKTIELVRASRSFDDNYRLIFHVGGDLSNKRYLEDALQVGDRILFSQSLLSNEELDQMIRSADIGVALYSEEHLGYRAELMGLAAGKIGNYLKCGVPIIASNMPSLKYIEDYHCGILVNDESEINAAVNQIMKDRATYSSNAYRCYNELWHPKNYLQTIYDKITEHSV
jgi:glycosyltransferase involved in cell wall biosynthesis